MAAPVNYRYSPVNHLIVDWGMNGIAFDNCSLPQPADCSVEDPTESPAVCRRLPITEAIDTYDWERWLPEVLVGIEDPDEEIAASYVREAAIEFSKGGRVLQREVVIPLQCGVTTYPVYPYEDERIIGVISARVDSGSACSCSSSYGQTEDIDWTLDVARNEIHIRTHRKRGMLRLLVWAAPTESACAHDVFLYEHFRSDITMGARIKYANAVHFRDRLLINSLPTYDMYSRAIVLAKTKVMRQSSSSGRNFASSVWGGGGCHVGRYRR